MFNSEFSHDGIRNVSFVLDKQSTDFLKMSWVNYLEKISPYPNHFDGKGIVICAGGVRFFTCAWVNIKKIRELGCMLPIEVWYNGDELSNEIKRELENLQVACKNFQDYYYGHLSGFALKPAAILSSSFKQILYLDSDNNCMRDPTFLFLSSEFLMHGSIFWPDYWRTGEDNPIWEITDCKDYDSPEQESGQILIDKERCWKELNLCLYFNIEQKYYYKMLFGDKDTFKFAWKALKKEYFMIHTPPSACGYESSTGKFLGVTMCQYDPNGQIIFLHRNLLKWDTSQSHREIWKIIKKIKTPSNVFYESGYVNSHYYIDISGDVEHIQFKSCFGDYEKSCIDILIDLEKSTFYSQFLDYTKTIEI